MCRCWTGCVDLLLRRAAQEPPQPRHRILSLAVDDVSPESRQELNALLDSLDQVNVIDLLKQLPEAQRHQKNSISTRRGPATAFVKMSGEPIPGDFASLSTVAEARAAVAAALGLPAAACVQLVGSSGVLADSDDLPSDTAIIHVHIVQQASWCLCSKEATDDFQQRRTFSSKPTEQSGDSVDLNKRGMGFACRKGSKPESPNQVSFVILGKDYDISIYGVFAGHGNKGHRVSDFVKENLPKLVLRDRRLRDKTTACLVEAFITMQQLIHYASVTKRINADMSGCSASLIIHFNSENKIFVASVGNVGSCIGKRSQAHKIEAIMLHTNHSPAFECERQRIEHAGGKVVCDHWNNHRVYAKEGHYPGLNTARALGDLLGHQNAGITATPSIEEYQLQANDELLLLCSGGAWQFMGAQAAADIVAEVGPQNAQKASEKLAKESWDAWCREEGDMGQVNDITALVIFPQETQRSSAIN